MIHLGDITKIDWSVVPPVDVVTGGSPCQDLSVAGKRAGLAGERSGLYMEQIRCVKELRAADEQRGRTGQLIRPRYMVWENVPGAFSSNKGKDFAAVLEEAVKIAQPQAPPIPVPEGGWPYAGCLTDGVAGRWSIAWRVHDAQFWGVAQRRRRISLVVDFGGLSATEILFERKGVSWNIETGAAQEERTAGGVGNGPTVADSPGAAGADSPAGARTAARAGAVLLGDNEPVDEWSAGAASVYESLARGTDEPLCFEPRSQDGCARIHLGGVTPTLNTAQGGQRQPCVLCLNDQGGQVMDVSHEQTATLRAQSHGHEPVIAIPINDKATRYKGGGPTRHGDGAGNGLGVGSPGDPCPTLSTCDRHAVCIGNGQLNQIPMSETANTLDTMHDQQAVLCYGLDCEHNAYPEQYGTMRAHASGGAEHKVMVGAIVRRLTPLECERLQGYPDGWTDIGEWVDSKGKRHKAADSPRYKALGNSIALPFWFWLLRRISAQYIGPATLGSLFDGIGGFPLCWERCNGKGTALWASEIEQFPMAVTKIRFGEEG